MIPKFDRFAKPIEQSNENSKDEDQGIEIPEERIAMRARTEEAPKIIRRGRENS